VSWRAEPASKEQPVGFFDKLKASVGVGGAGIQLSAPRVVCSDEGFRVRIAVTGGALEQKLNGLDVSLGSEFMQQTQQGFTTAFEELWKKRIDTAARSVIAKGSDNNFELECVAPSCQSLYVDDLEQYAALVLDSASNEEATHWEAELDQPLPFVSNWEGRKSWLNASADIPGAIDPSHRVRLHVIPEAAGQLTAVGKVTEDQLLAILKKAKATRVFVSNSSDDWFVWWSQGGGRVVGTAELRAIASVRPEGVVRSHTNRNIPLGSVLSKLPGETEDTLPGELPEARALARRLAEQAGLDAVLPRPVGNAIFGLSRLALLA
jgi:sporulation-control protein spo0M